MIEDLLGSTVGVMGLLMAVVFVAAGFKLWQQSREENAKKKS
ncbi:MAG: hypothetical protein ABR538_01080 [Candidatus Binatia bacterium]